MKNLTYLNLKKERIVIVGDFNLYILGTAYDLSSGNDICKNLLFFVCRLYRLCLKNNVLNFLGRTLDLVLSDIIELSTQEEYHSLVKIDTTLPY